MVSVQVDRYEKEIKSKGLLSYLKAKNDHFRSQARAFAATVAAVWPAFGFSIVASYQPDNTLDVMGAFLIGLFPSLFIGGFIFIVISFIGKEFVFRLSKNYRDTYNNLVVEQHNLVEAFKDIKNQKIILDFIEWKRKYHAAPVVFHDNRTKMNLDLEKMLVSAFANKNYDFAADIFVQFNDRIDSNYSNSKIENYRKTLDTVSLGETKELEMEFGDIPKKIVLKELL